MPFEGDEIDEFTEYIPYGRIDGTREFQAIIYWKAGVLRYEFILATFTPDGQPINHAIVGGTRYEDEGAIHSVAVVDENLHITIAEGMIDEHNADDYETQTYFMAVLPNGEIQYEVNEEKRRIRISHLFRQAPKGKN